MSDFEREITSYRLAQTHFGDDLQSVAAREMGDANRWPELVWLNNLTFPYLTDDELLAGPGVVLNGAMIKITAPRGVYTEDAETGQVFERDCKLSDKQLTVDEDGDLAVVAGTENLVQQLTHRINTPRGQARRHPEYGCLIWRLLGSVTGPTAAALGAQHVRAALESDYRIDSVKSSVAEIVGDKVEVTATAQTIAGSSVDLVAGS